jgi:nucleoside-diphosphate-sugar epimerase
LHLGFIHDFSNFEKSIKVDRAVINTIGDALEGTNKPFVLTSAVGLYEAGLKAGEELTEDTKVELDPHHFGYGRGMNEALALSLSERGVRATAIRLPPTVHGAGDPNFVARYINLSQKNGFVGYLTANNTWSAVNRDEVAKLYILAAQKGKAGSVYHGVDESVVKLKDLAETISKKLNIPAKGLTPSELSEAYDRFSLFLSMNIPVSSEKTQKELGWKPNGSTLFEDVRELY